MAVDPTYPMRPIACILAAMMLLLVLANSLIRRNWNLGVTFLCLWVLVDNVLEALNTIIWSDNANIKFYVYCDIGICPFHSLSSTVLLISYFSVASRHSHGRREAYVYSYHHPQTLLGR